MSMRKYALCGGAMGFTLNVIAIFSAGGGHGAYIPFFLFFAPISNLSMIIAFCGGGTLLYIVYAMLLSWGNRSRKGMSVLLVLIGFHSCTVAISMMQGWDYGRLQHLWDWSPLFTMATLAAFLLAITAAFYVVLRPPKNQEEFERCGQCGYNLTGNISGVCPECGTSIQTEPRP